MKDFISILVGFIFMSLAESVDSFFNNAISIDTIIVCSSLFSINLLGRSIGEIGTYTYRVVRKKESSYLLITGLTSLIIGFIIFLFKDVLVNLFDISQVQKETLSSVLGLYVFYLPASLVASSFLEMVRLKSELQTYRKSLILFYTLLIIFDAIAFYFTKNLVLLFVATIMANIINIIYLQIKMNFKIEGINKEDLENVQKYGITLVAERLLSRIFILVYGVLASYMGEKKYAIHSVCYAVCLNLEIITNAYSAALMIKIPEEKDKNKQMNVLRKYMNQCFGILLIINFGMAGITVVIQHGSLSIQECFPYIILYSCTVFGLFYYESYKALCVVQRQPKILLRGSTIGVIVRILICFIFLNTKLNLYIFSIASLIDFYVRGLTYKDNINKKIKESRGTLV